MAKFKPSLLTLALAAAGLTSSLISTSVYALEKQQVVQQNTEQEEAEKKKQEEQEAAEIEALEEENKLVITGFKGSLLRSIDEKRYADTVTEQLTADDLGGLPDVSIADALTRLPGISAVRTGGQAAEINIRGLSGVFVHTTLNGREQVSTSGSRSVEFDQYPSELISGATIYKSQKSSLIEGGVAGTVDLKTSSPLRNREKHTFNVNARGTFNDRADEVFDAKEEGHRFSFSYQGKFADDTLGVSLGYARLFQPNVAVQFIGFAYNTAVDVDGLPNDTGGPDNCPECEFVSEGFEMQHRGGEETRDGYVAAIEWTPNSDFSLKADAFISRFDSEAFARGFRVKFDGTLANIINPVIDDNAVIGGTINRTRNSNTRIEIVNDDNTDKDDVESFGVNAQWNLTDQFTLSTDVSRSTASSDFRNGLLWALVGEDANAATPVLDENVSIAYQLNGLDLPDVGFNQNFTNLDKVMLSKYGIFPFENEDELNAIRIDGKYDFVDNSFLSSFEVGLRYSEREYSNDRSVFQYGNDSLFSTNEPPLQLDSSFVQEVGFQGDFAHFPNYIAIDFGSALSQLFPGGVPQPVQTFGADSDGVINGSTDWSVLQSGDVFEDVFSGYFMASIDSEIGDTPLTGNIGMRIVRTDQSATTLTDVGGDPLRGAQFIVDEAGLVSDQFAPSIEGIKYTNYLPSLNLNFKIQDNAQIRFAAARVMSRPPINRLASSASGTVSDDGKFNASSTNSPFLKPFTATQYDLSYEYFFEDTEGAFVAAVFYKDIKSFVQTFEIPEFDFASIGIALPEYVPGTEPGNPDSLPPVSVTNGTFTTAVNNANGGYFRGIELAYTQIFSNLPDLWAGLGVNISYAYTDSQVDVTTDLAGGTRTITFPGLSEDVASGTLFWTYEDFETRLNVRYRSDFVSEQEAIGVQTTFFDSEMVVDYQASYMPTDNLRLLLQVNNLTDEPTKSFFGQQAQTGTIQFFGRQFFLGASYSL